MQLKTAKSHTKNALPVPGHEHTVNYFDAEIIIYE